MSRFSAKTSFQISTFEFPDIHSLNYSNRTFILFSVDYRGNTDLKDNPTAGAIGISHTHL